MARPLIVIDPEPRALEEIFDRAVWGRLESLGELALHEAPGRMPAERFESLLPEMELLIGQSDMPKSRLDRALKLRAIVNVETNFLQNVDYETCFVRGIHVLVPGSAFARPVAEMTLGLAIDLCRGVTAADRAMRAGREKWLLDGAEGCFSLYGASVGLVGFGDLARAFTPLLQPFGCAVKAYDPWISDHFIAGFGTQGRGADPLASSGGRDDGIASRDRPPDGGRRRPHPQGLAPALLPAGPARDGRAFAFEAGRTQLSSRSA
jgi:phosphoglycerate dehydrogenase-like enzyme